MFSGSVYLFHDVSLCITIISYLGLCDDDGRRTAVAESDYVVVMFFVLCVGGLP